MKALVINGPNLNLLGIREPDSYGKKDYAALVEFIKAEATKRTIDVDIFQSNSEGAIISAIQEALNNYDGIIINAAGYTHTSVAILDALKAVDIPAIEVHLTDINNREDFRKLSYLSMYAAKTICGKGFDGYAIALDELTKIVQG